MRTSKSALRTRRRSGHSNHRPIRELGNIRVAFQTLVSFLPGRLLPPGMHGCPADDNRRNYGASVARFGGWGVPDEKRPGFAARLQCDAARYRRLVRGRARAVGTDNRKAPRRRETAPCDVRACETALGSHSKASQPRTAAATLSACCKRSSARARTCFAWLRRLGFFDDFREPCAL